MRHRRFLVYFPTLLILQLAHALDGSSFVRTALNLMKLSNDSDLVIVGRTSSFTTVGKAPIKIGSTNFSADLRESPVRVLQVLKGHEQSTTILVDVAVLRPPEGSAGLNGIPDSTTRLLFLKRINDNRYSVTDSGHPSLPGLPVSVSANGNILDRVSEVECAVASAKLEALNNRLDAIWSLRGVQAGCVVPTLTNVASVETPALRLTAESELIRRNGITILPQAIEDALSVRGNAPEYLKDNIFASIGDGIRSEQAIPFLSPLLTSERTRARIAAVLALKNIGTAACIPDLHVLLADPNQEVRYFAVVALADISGLPHMHPSIPEFTKNQSYYLSYWMKATRQQK